MEEKIAVSVIIPAYKEKERIGKNLLEIKSFFEEQDISYEVIVVVDGSPDNTAEAVRTYADNISNLRVVDNAVNKGKGAVVRQGLLLARGERHVFLDADGSTSISHVGPAMKLMNEGAALVVGSRDIEGANIKVHQSFLREAMGTAGNWLIRIVLGLWSFPDTQCGFKMLTKEASHAVASRMVVDRFGFDFELIILAKKLQYTVVQMPVTWLNDEASTVGGLFGPNGFVRVIIDLFLVRLRLWTGEYGLAERRVKKTRV